MVHEMLSCSVVVSIKKMWVWNKGKWGGGGGGKGAKDEIFSSHENGPLSHKSVFITNYSFFFYYFTSNIFDNTCDLDKWAMLMYCVENGKIMWENTTG